MFLQTGTRYGGAEFHFRADLTMSAHQLPRALPHLEFRVKCLPYFLRIGIWKMLVRETWTFNIPKFSMSSFPTNPTTDENDVTIGEREEFP